MPWLHVSGWASLRGLGRRRLVDPFKLRVCPAPRSPSRPFTGSGPGSRASHDRLCDHHHVSICQCTAPASVLSRVPAPARARAAPLSAGARVPLSPGHQARRFRRVLSARPRPGRPPGKRRRPGPAGSSMMRRLYACAPPSSSLRPRRAMARLSGLTPG